MIYDCIIIGAGPAGLMAGAHLEGVKTLVLEGAKKPAQKLLISGSGQCNFTHSGPIRTFFKRYGAHDKFVRKALSGFTNEAVIAFFSEAGLKAHVREDGKVFPRSLDAWDVFKALRNRNEKNGVQICTESKALRVQRQADGFMVYGNQTQWKSKCLIIAAGGASYPMTGSDGSGFELAAQLGHTIQAPRPGLSPVYIAEFKLSELAGTVYPKGRLTHYRQNKKLASYMGDILITHTGLSGPCILDNSRYFETGDRLELNMLNEDITRHILEDKLLKGNKKRVKNILSECMTKRNAEVLVKLAEGVDEETVCAELTKAARKWLLQHAHQFPMTIKSLGALKSAMATAGGVSLKEVLSSTMASKLVTGLYFAGEVLDVDGDSGGYNIQWAFSSGMMAAMSVRKRLEEEGAI